MSSESLEEPQYETHRTFSFIYETHCINQFQCLNRGEHRAVVPVHARLQSYHGRRLPQPVQDIHRLYISVGLISGTLSLSQIVFTRPLRLIFHLIARPHRTSPFY